MSIFNDMATVANEVKQIASKALAKEIDEPGSGSILIVDTDFEQALQAGIYAGKGKVYTLNHQGIDLVDVNEWLEYPESKVYVASINDLTALPRQQKPA